MKKTIAALWHGTLSDTDCFVYGSPVLDDLEDDLEKLKTQFAATLNQEQLETFHAYVRFHTDQMEMRDELAFTNGFRVAARLFAEVYAVER